MRLWNQVGVELVLVVLGEGEERTFPHTLLLLLSHSFSFPLPLLLYLALFLIFVLSFFVLVVAKVWMDEFAIKQRLNGTDIDENDAQLREQTAKWKNIAGKAGFGYTTQTHPCDRFF